MFIFILLHVDDLAVAATNQELLEDLKTLLEETYVISEDPGLTKYIGFLITHNPNKSITISQPGMIDNLIAKYGIENPASTPMSANFSTAITDLESPLCDLREYQVLNGALLYICETRFDIKYAMNALSMMSSAPRLVHFQALKRVLRYLLGTRTVGLTYNAAVPNRDGTVPQLKLSAMVDAAHNVHSKSRSHIGFGFTLGVHNAMFMASSHATKTTLTSSTETETFALVNCTKNAMHFSNLLNEIGISQTEPIVIHEDNQSTISLCSNADGLRKKAKHYLAHINFVQDQIENKTIVLEYIPSESNVADALTKPLIGEPFTSKSKKMQGFH